MHTIMSGPTSIGRRDLYRALLILATAVLPSVAVANSLLRTTPGGLQHKEVLEGHGEPVASGQIAEIQMVMRLNEKGRKGAELHNSRGERKRIAFVLGTDYVMPALNEGIQGMKPGGRRLLLAPPAFAYDHKGLDGVIPPETSVILLVDLLAVREPDLDKISQRIPAIFAVFSFNEATTSRSLVP